MARRTLATAKRLVARNPRLKNRLKSALSPYFAPMGGTAPYDAWVATNLPDYTALPALKGEANGLKYRPLISVVVPTYNTDITFLRDCFNSVLGQVYDNWELCVVDDASTDGQVRETIREYAKKDARIRYTLSKSNQHIAGATNKAIAMATGEFVGLFDHDDILWPNALLEIAKALNADKKIDFLYTDEDKITENRHRHIGAFFKPDWNPDFLRSVNYITHFAVIRKTLLNEIGGLRGEYNGAQDWDLFLRITDKTTRICHIPKVVYSWRIHERSTAKTTDAKPYTVTAQKKALEDDLRRQGHADAIVEQDKKHTGYWNVTYPMQGRPLISIVIPTKNQYRIIRQCVDSIYRKTTYRNFEIVVVDTGSTDNRVLAWYKKMKREHSNFTLVDWPEQPFSYARSCNQGAKRAKGELLVMLNNDTEVLTPDWLELLAGDAQRKEVGAVGCLLFYPDKYHIQHAGVGVGLGGIAANSFQMMTLEQPMTQTQHLMLNTKHDMTAVTAACLMVKKSLYDAIGGFDEDFRVTYNDVDLCLRLYEKGCQNLYTPYVRLLHYESISVGLPEEVKKRDTKEFQDARNKFVTRWRKYVNHDPNLNPNLDKTNALYDIPDQTR